jgi:preprotein translocase subunit YajC
MPQTAQSVNPILNLFPLILIFVIFYFLLIRPQKSKEKEHQKLLENLNKNDEIVTSSGIHATVINVKDKTVIIRIDDNVKIEIEKNCISYVNKGQKSAEQKA